MFRASRQSATSGPTGGIERTVRGRRDLDRSSDGTEELVAHGDPRAGCQAAQLAVGPVVAHRAIERRDAVEGGASRVVGGSLAGGVHCHPNGQAHVDLRVFMQADQVARRRGDREADAEPSKDDQVRS